MLDGDETTELLSCRYYMSVETFSKSILTHIFDQFCRGLFMTTFCHLKDSMNQVFSKVTFSLISTFYRY